MCVTGCLCFFFKLCKILLPSGLSNSFGTGGANLKENNYKLDKEDLKSPVGEWLRHWLAVLRLEGSRLHRASQRTYPYA